MPTGQRDGLILFLRSGNKEQLIKKQQQQQQQQKPTRISFPPKSEKVVVSSVQLSCLLSIQFHEGEYA